LVTIPFGLGQHGLGALGAGGPRSGLLPCSSVTPTGVPVPSASMIQVGSPSGQSLAASVAASARNRLRTVSPSTDPVIPTDSLAPSTVDASGPVTVDPPVDHSPTFTAPPVAEQCGAAIARLDAVLTRLLAERDLTPPRTNGPTLFGYQNGLYLFDGKLPKAGRLVVSLEANADLAAPTHDCPSVDPNCTVLTEPDGTNISRQAINKDIYQVHIAKPDGTTVRLMMEGTENLSLTQLTAMGLDPGMTLYP
jgi:hypothetical protein